MTNYKHLPGFGKCTTCRHRYEPGGSQSCTGCATDVDGNYIRADGWEPMTPPKGQPDAEGYIWGCGHDCRDDTCTGCKVTGYDSPKKRRPKVLILGYARHGKDTVAEILRDEFGFTFASSSLFMAEAVVRPALVACGVHYETLEDCYADRVNRRAFWYEAIAAFNSTPTKLVEAILSKNDMYVGLRANREFAASMHLFDYVVWVDASRRGLPPEAVESMDILFDPEKMIVVDNGGSLEDLRENVSKLVESFA